MLNSARRSGLLTTNGETQKKRSLPRALTIQKEDLNIDLIGKVACVFIFLGPILVPLLWLSGVPLFKDIAAVGWQLGRTICSYTVKSFEIGGLPMMVCARCFGVACGLLTTGLLYHYSAWLQPLLPRRRLYTATLIGLLFVPWLIDSGLERLNLWVTDYWLMLPTGFLGGAALVLAPLVFFPLASKDKESLDAAEEI